MTYWTRGLTLLTALVLFTASLGAMNSAGDSKAKQKSAANQPNALIQTDFSYIVKGYPDKIYWLSGGTYVNCKGTSGRCILMDFETGVAMVDPDGCNMGPTYVGCQKVNGEYWTLVKQTPEVAIWLLHELQMTASLTATRTPGPVASN